MPSLVPGYEYDIFISYRQNDNRSGWVTEFVKALQEELSATLKDSVSVYFDTNPHDGLLETHDVSKSLEGKLNCLIFIPIISQTYCDPKSFAWQHEFCAFNNLAKESRFGRDIKLSNGNVSSRILPIKIHDVDPEDKALLEKELGSSLRAVEFIYKSVGVNRPLQTNEDHPQDNLNKTYYRDQINKTANALKEILLGIVQPGSPSVKSSMHALEGTTKSGLSRKKITYAALGLMILFALSYGVSMLIGGKKEAAPIHELEKSIAVLPFTDLSPKKDQAWFSDGLTEEILNSLTHVEGLNVVARTSSFAFKNKDLVVTKIADSLHVNYVVEGSVRKSGDIVRITAQLIRARDGFHIWSDNFDYSSTDIFKVQQEIASRIAENLGVFLDPATLKEMKWTGTNSPVAFLSYLKGVEIFDAYHEAGRRDLKILQRANKWFEEATTEDPEFAKPYYFHCDFFLHYLVNTNRQTYRPDTLSYKSAHELLIADLDQAIAKSKDEIDKDYFRLNKTMYSDDWTGIKSITERILANPEAAKPFSFVALSPGVLAITLGYGEKIRSICKEVLKNDPFNYRAQNDFGLSLIFDGDWDKVTAYADSIGEMNFLRVFLLIQQARIDEAFSLAEQNNFAEERPAFMAFLMAKKGRQREAETLLRLAREHEDRGLLWATREIQGKEAANKVAAELDRKLIIDFPLLYSYLWFPHDLPFDLSATPNFTRRLRQAGVIK